MARVAFTVGIVIGFSQYVIRKWISKKGQKDNYVLEAIDPDSQKVYTRAIQAGPIQDLNFGVSEGLSQGNIESYGIPELSQLRNTPINDSQISELVGTLKQKGGTYLARYAEISFSLARPTLISKFSNALNPRHLAGDTTIGAAQAVAKDHCQFALALDSLGEPRVSAACSGLYCYKMSTQLSQQQQKNLAAPCSQLSQLAVLAKDISPIQRVAKALSVPGSANKEDVTKIIIAKDLFKVAGGVVGDMLYNVAKQLSIEWAGREEVGLVELHQFLVKSTYLKQMQQAQGSKGSDEVGLTDRLYELAEKLYSQSFASSDMYRQLKDKGNSLPQEVSTEMERIVQGGTQNGKNEAKVAADELGEMIKRGLSSEIILLLPSIPPNQPSNAKSEEIQSFIRIARSFQVLANLTCSPTVTIPIYLGKEGMHSITLLGMPKTDLHLLQLASKMVKFIPKAIERAESLRKTAEAKEVQTSKAQVQKRSIVEKQETESDAEKAEKVRLLGNEAFKSGQLADAVVHYTNAIKLNPKSAVCYSNRAMAYLKMLLYEEAEADCDRALKLELSPKTLLRRATARQQQGKMEDAEKDFKQVLYLEPNNRQAAAELKSLQMIRDMV